MEDDLVQRRFLWGLLLSWSPWVPTLFGIGAALVGVLNSKATGIAVLAGGIAELLVWWGIVAILISQIAAITWLARSFSTTHIWRSLIAAASIFASTVTLFLMCAFLFWGRHILEHAASR